MIYSIQGKISEIGSDFIIVETESLSYQIFISDFFLKKLKLNQKIKLYTFLEVKENLVELYGFENKKELQYFKYLHSISGIGPKSAINVLSLVKVSDLEQAIINEQESLLTKVSGIGKKTAQRIILELKEKIMKTGATAKKFSGTDSLVIDALINMGYSPSQARETIKKIPSNIEGIKEKIKQALKYLSKN